MKKNARKGLTYAIAVACCILVASKGNAQTPLTEVQRLTHTCTDASSFGAAVDIHGDLAVAFKGCNPGPGSGNGVGAVSIRERNTGGPNMWGESGEITVAMITGTGAQFNYIEAYAVAVNEFYIAISGSIGGSNPSDAVFIFDAVPTPTSMVHFVRPPSGISQISSVLGRFGGHIALDGHKVIIGCSECTGTLNGAGGGVFIYDALSQVTTELVPPPSLTSKFGHDVASNNAGRITVSAMWQSNYSGVVYTYEFGSGMSYSQGNIPEITSDGGFDLFGYSLDMNVDRLVVGAPEDDGQGAVYPWTWNGSAWSGTPKLLDPTPTSYFGSAVAVGADHVLASDHFQTQNSSVEEFLGSSNTYSTTLSYSMSTTADKFGCSIAIDDQVAVVGAWTNPPSGAAYIFESACPPAGTICDNMDGIPNNSVIDGNCNCVLAECVQLVMQYGASPQAVDWEITGLNHPFPFTDNDPSPPANQNVFYTYMLPTGGQGTPYNYSIAVNAPSGGLRGWRLITCAGPPILDNDRDWSPGTGTTLSGPYEACTNPIPQNNPFNNFIDFQLPLGPMSITAIVQPAGLPPCNPYPTTYACGDDDVPLRWSNCNGEYSCDNLQITATGATGIYDLQILDPDGRNALLAGPGCSAAAPQCDRIYANIPSGIALSLSGQPAFKPVRGVWLNMRARTGNNNGVFGNFGEVCTVCFSRTGVTPCPPLPPAQQANRRIIETDYPSIELWPNPSNSGNVNLHVIDLDVNSTTAQLSMYDALGKLIWSDQLQTAGEPEITTMLDLTELIQGIYLLQVRSGDRTFTHRWVRE